MRRRIPLLLALLTATAPLAAGSSTGNSQPGNSRPSNSQPGGSYTGNAEAGDDGVWPRTIELVGAGTAHRVLSSAPLVSRDPTVARVEANRVVAAGDGETIVDTAGREVRVTVRGTRETWPVGFERDVLPAVSRLGCNAAVCHGAALGQAGFKLSLFGTDPAADHVALVRELGGRRIDRARPAESLFLMKPTRGVPHEGGKLFQRGDATWELLATWAEEGFRHAQEPAIVGLEVRASRPAADWTGELAVRATYADGSARDVTDLAEHTSTDEGLAWIDEDGHYSLDRPGEAVFMVRFAGRVATASMSRPYPAEDGAPPRAFGRQNFVDDHVNAKLGELGLRPSPACDDETFARRAWLALTGTLPTADDVRRFLDEPDRRALVERLVQGPEFETYWAWRLDQWFAVGSEGTDARSFHGWLAGRVRAPWSETAALLVRGDGTAPAANLYRLSPDPKVTAENVGRIFLGTRWMCAQCHDHPFESFRQEDYFGVAALFARLRQTDGAVHHIDRGELLFPRTGRPALPRFPDGTPAPVEGDRRDAVAEWLAREPQLGRALANRVWALTMGRGLVEPVDDFRSSNPPTHPELLAELGRLDSIPALVRAIAASAAFERAGPTAANAADDRFYSHRRPVPLDAEVFVDAVARAAGVPDAWPGRAAGTRAVELGDVTATSHRLDVCGRGSAGGASSLARELHFLNGPGTLPKLAGVAPLLPLEDQELVRELFLQTLSRHPSTAESELATRALRDGPRREVAEDLLWALLNSTEFATCR